MADLDSKRYNEKLKGLSALGCNGGLLIIGASAARWYDQGLDLIGLLWILVAAIVIWSSIQLLTALRAED